MIKMLKEEFPEDKIGRMKMKLSTKKYVINEKGCHLWTGAMTRQGYGKMQITATNVQDEKQSFLVTVHRLGATILVI